MKTIKFLLCLIASFSFQVNHASQVKYQPSSTGNFQAAVLNEVTAEQIDALMQKPDINKPIAAAYHQTALMVFACQKKFDCLKALLKYKPNLDAQDPNGHTAIHYAIIMESWDCYKALIQAGANVNIKTNRGALALAMLIRKAAHHSVAQDIRQLALDCIKDHKTDLDLQEDDDGNNALMIAIEKGSLKIAKTIIKRGADLFLRNKNNKTAFDLSKEGEEMSKKASAGEKLELYQGISEELNDGKKGCIQTLFLWDLQMRTAYLSIDNQKAVANKLFVIVSDYLGMTRNGSEAIAGVPASSK